MEIVVLLLLILLNGVFSMSEIAMVSLRKARVEAMAGQGNSKAKAALRTVNSPNKFLSTVQIGITLIGILTGIYSGENLTQDLAHTLSQVEFLAAIAEPLAVGIVVVAITFATLVLGELVPKRLGLANPEGIALSVARPMEILSKITAPFVWLLTQTSGAVARLLGIKKRSSDHASEEEIRAIVREATLGGEVQKVEQDIMERVFKLGDTRVADLMVHRSELVMLRSNWSKKEVAFEVTNEVHDVYPVLDGKKDSIVGVVHLRDLVQAALADSFELSQLIRKANYLVETSSVYKALQQFKDTGEHYGLVVDEFGQVEGMLTLTDILEALAGDSQDFDKEDPLWVARPDGTFLADGRYPLHEMLPRFGLEDALDTRDYHTLSGLILHLLERLPKTGEVVNWNHLSLEVVDMDGPRIDKVLISVRADESATTENED